MKDAQPPLSKAWPWQEKRREATTIEVLTLRPQTVHASTVATRKIERKSLSSPHSYNIWYTPSGLLKHSGTMVSGPSGGCRYELGVLTIEGPGFHGSHINQLQTLLHN